MPCGRPPPLPANAVPTTRELRKRARRRTAPPPSREPRPRASRRGRDPGAHATPVGRAPAPRSHGERPWHRRTWPRVRASGAHRRRAARRGSARLASFVVTAAASWPGRRLPRSAAPSPNVDARSRRRRAVQPPPPRAGVTRQYNASMISVPDAQARILAGINTAAPEIVPVAGSLGRVTAEDIRASVDVPPTDNSAVDGYAVTAADIPASGTRELEVVAEVAAGSVFAGALGRGQALRIMTGAPMPVGADTVYPQEIVTRAGNRVAIPPIAAGVNVRERGEDVEAGAVVLPSGTVLRPQELGVAASLGLAQLLVRQRPRVAILSTGDEVAEPGGERKPGQIYDSNRFALRALAEAAGAEVTDYGIVPDLFAELRSRLLAAAATAHVVLTSGGVSVGDYDLVK